MSRKRCQFKRVHIEGETWTYQVGGSHVSIKDPKGKRTVVHRSKVVRGQPHNYQRNFDPDYAGPRREADMFTYPTPAIVKNYIWRKLRSGQLIKEPGDYDQAKDAIFRYFEGDVKHEPELIAGAQR
jgi:hypothetical protein